METSGDRSDIFRFTEDQAETLLRSLVSIRSPYFSEAGAMAFVNEWLNGHGVPAGIHEYHADIIGFDGQNVAGCFDSGVPGPVIFLGGHLDTVSLCEGWTRPPFDGVREGDRFYGVGALDMKSGDAALMLALAALAGTIKDRPGQFRGKIIYQFESDEEGPYGLGTLALIHDNVGEIADGVDFAIICEPSAGFTETPHPCLCVGARGGYNYKVRIHGKATHAATPEKGVNALEDAARVILAIKDMPRVQDEKLGNSVPCVIDAGTEGSACSVPDHAFVEVFHHCVRGETLETIRKEVTSALDEAGLAGTYEIEFRAEPGYGSDGGFVPYCIDENNKYLISLSASAEKICGRKVSYSCFQSIGDFNHIGGLLGIPTVLFGAEGANFHAADEYVLLHEVPEIAATICDFLLKTNFII